MVVSNYVTFRYDDVGDMKVSGKDEPAFGFCHVHKLQNCQQNEILSPG